MIQNRNRFTYPSTRRGFVTGVTSSLLMGRGMMSARAASHPARRLVYLFLSGGASQLETWDPKPGAAGGGPFGAVDTTVSGVRISELMPRMAKQMHRVALVRSLNSEGFGDGHDGAGILCGRKPQEGFRFPTLCEIAARGLGHESRVPALVELQSTDAYRFESRAAAPNSPRAATTALVTDGAVTLAAAEAAAVVESRLGLPERDIERYGSTELGRFCAQARRLVEAGVPVVKIRHHWWDTHAEHFERHAGLVRQLDVALSTLLQDLHDRGLLEETLVVVASEFGRSPEINRFGGRDHWTRAWSVALAGAGVSGGVVVGRTSEDGRGVVEQEVTPADLHRTCLHTLGIHGDQARYDGGRAIPLAEPSARVVGELVV